ncbi:MAG: acetamidase/formamidase family protein [Candidatus Fermentithermobacillus carboniphilus]|uniref:Acetamidase/formamidase family protein n=1 Tax=Candidatus Fermentithermobacillus carboniphilus TaxID=3085328 RepID=A0AAT9LCL1_9FIRM|nr:MAG: acetamidase/formamidase family protein [Candidatus Fermentithermobacillus carboniphilus]
MTDARGQSKIISADHVIYAFGPEMTHCKRVLPGEILVFETQDCFGGQIKTEEDTFDKVGWDRINPATGPVFIEGAEPGDTLSIEIRDIQVKDTGIMVQVPKMGALGHLIRNQKTVLVTIRNGLAHMPNDIILECRPMIGVIGVAPAQGCIPTGTPGPHGGNMDTRVITKGSTVYLPVNVPGALLALGDLHALMGDGEVLICGIETAGTVTVTTHVLKRTVLPCPVVETESAFYTIWSEESLDRATGELLERTVQLVSRATGWSIEDTIMMLSVKGNLGISQVVDPLKTVRMEIPKSLLKGKSLVI